MKYAIFTFLFTTFSGTFFAMEPANQLSHFFDQDFTSEEMDRVLQTLESDAIFQEGIPLPENESFPQPILDFQSSQDFSLPLETLDWENVKPSSANNSPVKPIKIPSPKKRQKSAVKKQLSFKDSAPEETATPQDSPEKKLLRKRFLKEMRERNEQKRLKLLADFYKSDSTQSLEAKEKSQQLEKQLAQRKEQHRLNNVVYDLNKNIITQPSSSAVIAPKELSREQNLVFVQCVVVEAEKTQSSHRNESQSNWPEHILAMIAAKDKPASERTNQKNITKKN